MAAMEHSSTLFLHEDGRPIHFYMHPCTEKAKLKPFVEHGGGIISSKAQKDSIKLATEFGSAKYDDYILATYITDCVAANRLQDKSKYNTDNPQCRKMALNSTKNSSFTDDLDLDDLEEASEILRGGSKYKQGRQKYLISEDVAILNFLYEERGLYDVGGNGIWKSMEKKEVTKHPWQSMRDRFLKVIKRDIKQYHLSPAQVAYFNCEVLNGDRSAESPPRKRTSPRQGSSVQKRVKCPLSQWLSKSEAKTAEAVGDEEDEELDELDHDLLKFANRSEGQEQGKSDQQLENGSPLKNQNRTKGQEGSGSRPSRLGTDLTKSPLKKAMDTSRGASIAKPLNFVNQHLNTMEKSVVRRSPRKIGSVAYYKQPNNKNGEASKRKPQESDSENESDWTCGKKKVRPKKRKSSLVDFGEATKRKPQESDSENGSDLNCRKKRGRPMKRKNSPFGKDSSSPKKDALKNRRKDIDEIGEGSVDQEVVVEIQESDSENESDLRCRKKRGRPMKRSSPFGKDCSSPGKGTLKYRQKDIEEINEGSVGQIVQVEVHAEMGADSSPKHGHDKSRTGVVDRGEDVSTRTQVHKQKDGNDASAEGQKDDTLDNMENGVIGTDESSRVMKNVEQEESVRTKPALEANANRRASNIQSQEADSSVDVVGHNKRRSGRLQMGSASPTTSSTKKKNSDAELIAKSCGDKHMKGQNHVGKSLPGSPHKQPSAIGASQSLKTLVGPGWSRKQMEIMPIDDIVSVSSGPEQLTLNMELQKLGRKAPSDDHEDSCEELEDYMESMAKLEEREEVAEQAEPRFSEDLFPELSDAVAGSQPQEGATSRVSANMVLSTPHRVVGSMTPLPLWVSKSSRQGTELERARFSGMHSSPSTSVMSPDSTSLGSHDNTSVQHKAAQKLQTWIMSDSQSALDHPTSSTTSGNPNNSMVLLDRRKHVMSITDKIKRVCRMLGLEHIELLSIVWACNGSLERAVHWILHNEVPAGDVFWSAEDDIILESGSEAELTQLRNLYGKFAVEERLRFLTENLSS